MNEKINYIALRDIVLSGPLAAECQPHVITNDMAKVSSADAVLRDQAIADILNADARYSASAAVPAWIAKKLLIKRGRWRSIVMAANDPNHPAVEAAYAAVALAEDARMDADFLDPAAELLLGALVAANLISADDLAALQTLSRRMSNFTSADISRALRGPWE